MQDHKEHASQAVLPAEPSIPPPPGRQAAPGAVPRGSEVERPPSSGTVEPPIRANMTSDPERLFVVEPEVVYFTDYGEERRRGGGGGGDRGEGGGARSLLLSEHTPCCPSCPSHMFILSCSFRHLVDWNTSFLLHLLLPPPPPPPPPPSEVGKVFTQRVLIRNVTRVIRSLRIIPPASQYFHVSLSFTLTYTYTYMGSLISHDMLNDIIYGIIGSRPNHPTQPTSVLP
jgi:hypothetical protein